MRAPYPPIPSATSTTSTIPEAFRHLRSGRPQGWQPDYPGAALRRSVLWAVVATVLGLGVLLAAHGFAHTTAAHQAVAHRSSAPVVYDTVGPTKPLPPPAPPAPIPQIVEATSAAHYSVTIPSTATPTPPSQSASQSSGGNTGGTTGGAGGGTQTGGHHKHKHSG